MKINNFLVTISNSDLYFWLFALAIVIFIVVLGGLNYFFGKQSSYVFITITIISTVILGLTSEWVVEVMFDSESRALVHEFVLRSFATLSILTAIQFFTIILLALTYKKISAKMFRYKSNGVSIYQDRIIGAGIGVIATIPSLFVGANLFLSHKLGSTINQFVDSITTVVTIGKVKTLSNIVDTSDIYVKALKDESEWEKFVEIFMPDRIISEEDYRDEFVLDIDKYSNVFRSATFTDWVVGNFESIEKEFGYDYAVPKTFDTSQLLSVDENLLLADEDKFEINSKKNDFLKSSLTGMFMVYGIDGTTKDNANAASEKLIKLYFNVK